MRGIFFTFFILLIFSSTCFSQSEPGKNAKSEITIKTFSLKENSWGYDILRNGKLLVHQPHIPAVPGNVTFKTETEARKVAGLVKSKVEKNIMPPTVTIQELDDLKIKCK